MLFRRQHAFVAAASRLVETPVLLDGDATELLAILREGALASNLRIVDAASQTEPARIAILVVTGDGRRSAFTKASRKLRELDAAITSDAVRLVVIQSDRSRVAPPKLQRLLSEELLFQVTLALPGYQPRRTSRSFRQALGLATLDAAGLRVLRFG